MEKEFKPKTPKQQEVTIDPSVIKQEYAQMHQEAGNQQPSEEEIKENKKRQEAFLDEELPFLRKSVEYTRLKQELFTLECRMPDPTNPHPLMPSQIPGTLGRQLEIEQLESQLHWANLKMEQNEMMKKAQQEKADLERKQEQEKDKGRDVTVVFDKDWAVPGSMGTITIPQGKEYIISNAQDIKVDVPVSGLVTEAQVIQTETRSFSIHKLEDQGIVRIIR